MKKRAILTALWAGLVCVSLCSCQGTEDPDEREGFVSEVQGGETEDVSQSEEDLRSPEPEDARQSEEDLQGHVCCRGGGIFLRETGDAFLSLPKRSRSLEHGYDGGRRRQL